jgi:hypothetical protein
LIRGRADVPVLGIGAAVIGVICCAGLPAITALIGGITIAAVVGVAGGGLALAAIATGAVRLIRARRRRNASATTRRSVLS